MATLFRLKSNPNTIVRKDGPDYGKVAWSKLMLSGYDSRWMLHRWNDDNVVPLTKDEAKATRAQIAAFDERRQLFSMSRRRNRAR